MQVKPIHLLLFGALVVAAVMCNTTRSGSDLFDRQRSWRFADDAVRVEARHVDDLPDGGAYRDVKVFFNDESVFDDQRAIFTDNMGLLPIGRGVGEGRTELLLGLKADPVDRILRLMIAADGRAEIDTLPLFKGMHNDSDGDGLVEFSGFVDRLPPPCLNCDSLAYNPLHFWEMRPDGFAFDSLATRQWIEIHYGSFHGFAPRPELILPFGAPPPIII